MPANPWLAIDATTPPQLRAREVRRAWERFVGEGVTVSPGGARGLRAPIIASWQRSHEAGVDPFLDPVAPVVADPDEVEARWEFHPLSAAVPVIRDCVGEALGEAQGLIVVTDAEGTILWIDGDARVRIDTADMVNLAVGASLRESGAGTNAVGTALAAQHAVQVFCE